MNIPDNSISELLGSFSIKIILFIFLSCVFSSSVFAVNIYTKKGPAVVIRSSGSIHMFFTGHNNDYIWEADYNPDRRSWTAHGQVMNSANQAARTTERPAPLTANKLFFHGNVANDYIWYVDRTSTSREWGRPRYLKYSLRSGEPATETFLMRSSPAVHTFSWLALPLSAHNVFYTDLDTRRIKFTAKLRSGNWSRPQLLPTECVSNVGPAVAAQGGKPLVFYAKRHTHEIFVAVKGNSSFTTDDWTVVGIPRAFTTTDLSATNINDGGILLSYKGHNNNKIWLRLYRPAFGNILHSSSWRRLGYVAGVETDQAPAIAYRSGTLVLAFKNPDVDVSNPLFTVDIGYLTLNEANRHDTPGHTFESFR